MEYLNWIGEVVEVQFQQVSEWFFALAYIEQLVIYGIAGFTFLCVISFAYYRSTLPKHGRGLRKNMDAMRKEAPFKKNR